MNEGLTLLIAISKIDNSTKTDNTLLYKAYYISNQKQKQVDISKIFKDEVNNVFDTNIFRQVKTGNFISKAHVYLNS